MKEMKDIERKNMKKETPNRPKSAFYWRSVELELENLTVSRKQNIWWGKWKWQDLLSDY